MKKSNYWFELELRAVVADLQSLYRHFGDLSEGEVVRHLRNSTARQEGLIAVMDELSDSSEETVFIYKIRLEEFRDWQRKILLKAVQRFYAWDSAVSQW